MSEKEETEELKAGHAPAMKVGNMRVPGKRNDSGSEKITGDELAKQAEEFGTEKTEKPKEVAVSGVVVKDDKAFPPEAVKAYHEKPLPAHSKGHAPQHHNIQQPRK